MSTIAEEIKKLREAKGGGSSMTTVTISGTLGTLCDDILDRFEEMYARFDSPVATPVQIRLEMGEAVTVLPGVFHPGFDLGSLHCLDFYFCPVEYMQPDGEFIKTIVACGLGIYHGIEADPEMSFTIAFASPGLDIQPVKINSSAISSTPFADATYTITFSYPED